MHSFVSCLVHCVFSTKERRKLITSDLQERLYPYLGGIARENKMKALSIGGVEDHVHLLLSIPSTLSIAKSVQLLKGNSSKWIHETFARQRLSECARGVWSFQHCSLRRSRHDKVYSISEGTSSATFLQGRTDRLS